MYICCIFVGLLTVNWEELISRAKLWGQVVGVAGRMLMGTPHKVPGSVDALQGGFSRMEKHEKKTPHHHHPPHHPHHHHHQNNMYIYIYVNVF